MTERSPLMLKDGIVAELPKGDTVRGATTVTGFIPQSFEPLPLELSPDLRFALELTGLF